MSLSDMASRLESLSKTAIIGGRTLLDLDTNSVPGDWNHITKVDPESEKQIPLAYPLYLSQTSAVSIGGSRDVTDENTEETFEIVTAADVPAFHEPSAARHVTERTRDMSDFLAVPEVLNGDSTALVGILGEGIEYVREDLGPRMAEEKLGISMDGAIGDRIASFASGYLLQTAVFEAYIIMNPDSAAAREANVSEDDLLSPQEAKQRAMAAEHHLESEVIYLEYSGTFGGEEAVEILETIDDSVSWPRIWYGGGLDNRENAAAVLDAGADAVIVGDIFHDIASEEVALYERARDELDSPDRDEIRDWLDDSVDVEDTSARRYLATIPDVPDPEDRARRYLAAGIEMAFAIDELASAIDDPSASAVRRALRTETTPGESAFADVLDDDASDVATSLSTALVAGRHDVETEDGFSARHFALTD